MICPISQRHNKSPQGIALIESGTSISYAELERQVRTTCSVLEANKIRPGDRVAILGGNSSMVIVSLFALSRLKASAIFLNLQLSSADWVEQLNTSGAVLLLAEEQLLASLPKSQISSLSFSKLRREFEQGDLGQFSAGTTNLDLKREAAVVFTSSQTGHKKGVVLTLDNFVQSALASNAITKLAPGDTWALSLPLYHVGGLGIIYRTILAGACSFILPDFSSETILSLLLEKRVSHLSLVPTVLIGLVEAAEKHSLGAAAVFSGVKAIILAGAASSPTLLDKIIRYKLPVLSAWGMTETTAHCTCTNLDDDPQQVRTVGRAFPHTKLRIVSDGGQDLPPNEEGEILVKGPTVCGGYLHAEESLSLTADGWLATGDLGVLDERGYLSIVGRKDDMLISGGENIHASEIEAVASLHPQVSGVAVIAVPHPKWGQRPIIYAEPRCGESLDEKQLHSFLRERLAKIKVPDRVIVMQKLPRTGIGKVDYKRLRAING